MPQLIMQPLRRWDPERIGPYAIIGKLGAGAMGQVFLAKSAAGRLVAVKTIRVDLAEEPGFRDRFAREVAAARRVSGVFTASVIEADPEADLPWVATAYVPAPSLSTLVKEAGPLPVPAVRWLAAGCAEALQSIHATGLLHRDVKPSNVLVAPDGPRVIDFGLARAAERVELTTTRGASGTPAYMAPEQARDASQASPAGDVFSLGATLVYAATGHSPYQGDTVMDILVRLATEPPDLSGVPPELTGLVAACLERKPRDRPSSAAILQQLGQFTHPVESGHGYLPGSAMTVIADYQRSPQRPTGELAGLPVDRRRPAGEEPAGHATAGSGVRSGAEGTTAGSHTALPGFQSLNGFQSQPGDGAAREPDAGDATGSGSLPSGWATSDPTTVNPPPREPEPGRRHERRGWRPAGSPPPGTKARPLLPLWGRVAAAVVLLGAGVGIGVLVRGSGPGTTFGPPGLPPCQPRAGAAPTLCVSQPWGDGGTVYVVRGIGFPADARVSLSLSGTHAAPGQLTADQAGTFNYAVDQGHHFFPGTIPVGTYHCTVSTAGVHGVIASFRVYPAGQVPAQPPPPQAPPGQGQGQGQGQPPP